MTIATEILHAPIHPIAGQRIEHKRYRLAPDFRPDPGSAAIAIENVADVVLRDVEIDSGVANWDHDRWDHPETDSMIPGIPHNTVGVRVQIAPRLVIDGLKVRGFPQSALDVFGITSGKLRNIAVTHCYQGICSRQYKRSRWVTIEHVFGRDLWGPGPGHIPGIAGYPSVLRGPGEFIGSDLLAVGCFDDSLVRNVHARGEYLRAMKFVGTRRCRFENLSGNSIMFQGTSMGSPGLEIPISGCVLRDSLFDRALGYGECTEEISHTAQLSLDIVSLRVERCTFVAGGKLGNASQHADRVHADYYDCLFHGYNQAPPPYEGYALDLQPGCTANADFETVNRFVDQKNLVHRRAA